MIDVLVYVRPWNHEQFLDLASGVWPGAKLHEVSEHRKIDRSGLEKNFNMAYRETEKIPFTPEWVTETDVLDVILRCRLLRAIDNETALRLVAAMSFAIDTLLDRIRPHAMLSITCDSYVLHLFVLACRHRNVPFIGLVPTFVNGYFRITALGEYTPSREVDDFEVEQVLAKILRPDYMPDFVPTTRKEQKQKAFRLWRRTTVKPFVFALKRCIEGEPLNYHYWATEVVSRQYWSLRMQSYDGMLPKNQEEVSKLALGRPIIYFPLQMSPEATIDYWSCDAAWIKYEEYVCNIIKEYGDIVFFLVKEHPNIMGYRKTDFYRKLKGFHNCLLVASEMPSNTVLEMSDGVLVCTGTVGFEAALRGLPVFTNSCPYHLPRGVARKLTDLRSNGCEPQDDAKSQLSLVRFLLSGLLPGRFVNDGTWSKNENDQSEIINNIREFFESRWI